MEKNWEKGISDKDKESNPETLRHAYAEQVKFSLHKYKENITQFNLMTSSNKSAGFWDTNEGVKPVIYDSRYDKDFEFYGLERGESNSDKTGYVYDKEINKVTFQGYLGRTLHTKDRDGNALLLTLKFDKNLKPQELINNISKLMDTIVAYRGNDKSSDRTVEQDIQNIAKEAITTLEAFEEISEKFPSTGRISVKSMIEEYKELLK